MSSKRGFFVVFTNNIHFMVTGGAIDAILRDEEHSEHNSDDEDEIQIQMKHKAINRLSCKSSCMNWSTFS